MTAPTTATTLTEPQHTPRRPSWTCDACEKPDTEWPCSQAKTQMSEQYRDDRVGLSVLMGARLIDADQDLPGAEPRELYARFVGWVR